MQVLGIIAYFFGHIAQLVEQGTENPCVPSSILGVATTLILFITLK